jgi:hypothetical protein
MTFTGIPLVEVFYPNDLESLWCPMSKSCERFWFALGLGAVSSRHFSMFTVKGISVISGHLVPLMCARLVLYFYLLQMGHNIYFDRKNILAAVDLCWRMKFLRQ